MLPDNHLLLSGYRVGDSVLGVLRWDVGGTSFCVLDFSFFTFLVNCDLESTPRGLIARDHLTFGEGWERGWQVAEAVPVIQELCLASQPFVAWFSVYQNF